MRMKQVLQIGLGAVVGVAGVSNAQPEAAPVTAAVTQWAPSWGDAEMTSVAEMLSGTWRTADAVQETNADGSVQMVMQIAPVAAADGTAMLYAEISRADQMEQPFRQSLFGLYRYKGQIRLRTYEIMMPKSGLGALVGLWAAPEFFPAIGADGRIATLDVALTAKDGSFSGLTPYPYPTAVGGAVEMTSHVTFNADRLTTADRGFDAEGNVVWGADQGDAWTWNKVENPVRVTVMDKGVVAVDYARPEGVATVAGDKVFVHYSGWTGNGNQFDSSRPRNQPYELTFPAPGRLIEGWGIGLADMTVGTKRRLIIPSDVGYGVNGQPRAKIMPNETLFFEIELMAMQKPDAAEEDHSGHDHEANPHP